MALDYENDTQKTFDLTVKVTDSAGLMDTTQVRITVTDENDNLPLIINLPSPAEFNISDNVPAGEFKYEGPRVSFFKCGIRPDFFRNLRFIGFKGH